MASSDMYDESTVGPLLGVPGCERGQQAEALGSRGGRRRRPRGERAAAV